ATWTESWHSVSTGRRPPCSQTSRARRRWCGRSNARSSRSPRCCRTLAPVRCFGRHMSTSDASSWAEPKRQESSFIGEAVTSRHFRRDDMENRRVYVLGGHQTDFARNWTKEGKHIAAMIREAVAGGLEATRIEPKEVQVGHVGNFAAELYSMQG